MRELVINKCYQLQHFEKTKELRKSVNYNEYLNSLCDEDLFDLMLDLVNEQERWWIQ